MLYQTSAMIHFTFEVDVSTYETRCQTMKEMVKKIPGDFLTVSSNNRTWHSSTRLLDNTCQEVASFAGGENQRIPRQLEFIFTALVGTVFGLYEETRLHQLDTDIRANQDQIHHHVLVLHNHETRLSQVEQANVRHHQDFVELTDHVVAFVTRSEQRYWQ
jgi:hypothetical protein